MKTLVIAPHPDDELLGCGGTLLRRSSEGVTVGWLLVTAITVEDGWAEQKVLARDLEIERVRKGLGISSDNLYKLGYSTSKLDRVPTSELISRISSVFEEFKPEEVFLPHPGDIHSDHRITFEAVSACTKWFRYPSIKTVLTYETLSETNFQLPADTSTFTPNLFSDITQYLQQKLELLSIYSSELSFHPFPRSLDAIRSLALLRGTQRGTESAEAFQLLRHLD